MMTLKIVDCSSYQGNYKVGSNGEDGVIIKATEGMNYVNPYCDYVAQQAIKKGLPWGLYHYTDGVDANGEADYFISHTKGYFGISNEPIIFLDWESGNNKAWGNGSFANDFINRIKSKLGKQAGIYTGSDGVSQTGKYLSGTAPLWFAGYPTSSNVGWSPVSFPYSTGSWKTLTGWQFSSNPVDKSLFYVDVNAWKKIAGSKATPVTPKPQPKPSNKSSFTDSLGCVWYRETGTFTSNTSLYLRWGATTRSTPIALLGSGSSINYDAYCYSGGYVWIRQPRNGSFGYAATGEESNGHRTSFWGSFK